MQTKNVKEEYFMPEIEIVEVLVEGGFGVSGPTLEDPDTNPEQGWS